jgi:hypothetical protein
LFFFLQLIFDFQVILKQAALFLKLLFIFHHLVLYHQLPFLLFLPFYHLFLCHLFLHLWEGLFIMLLYLFFLLLKFLQLLDLKHLFYLTLTQYQSQLTYFRQRTRINFKLQSLFVKLDKKNKLPRIF